MRAPMIATPARPPITPPAIAPALVFFFGAAEALGADGLGVAEDNGFGGGKKIFPSLTSEKPPTGAFSVAPPEVLVSISI